MPKKNNMFFKPLVLFTYRSFEVIAFYQYEVDASRGETVKLLIAVYF